ncbi:hypothetical protein CEXT_156961 [Caerostris extrusa]|uniref:Uncharacterized protein n=1 Tax=Caerostris extrusa TaxID=172846 RepID=A0AAV4NYM7_CAEEX|nr:hypothetical protein CEXT_156961 [Caerostris extrusa]
MAKLLQTLHKIADAVAFAFQDHLIDLLAHDYDVAHHFVKEDWDASSSHLTVDTYLFSSGALTLREIGKTRDTQKHLTESRGDGRSWPVSPNKNWPFSPTQRELVFEQGVISRDTDRNTMVSKVSFLGRLSMKYAHTMRNNAAEPSPENHNGQFAGCLEVF